MAIRPVTVLLLVLVLVGCQSEIRRGDPALQVRVTVEPDPPTVGSAHVQVALGEMDWSPRNGDRVLLTGSRDNIVLARDTAVGQGAGIYLAEDFRFEVSGDWTLTVRVETRDGRWVEVDHPIPVTAEGSGSS